MSVAIFQAYIDYCKRKNKTPDSAELQEWKKKYNNR